jgi:hypothetical protein
MTVTDDELDRRAERINFLADKTTIEVVLAMANVLNQIYDERNKARAERDELRKLVTATRGYLTRAMAGHFQPGDSAEATLTDAARDIDETLRQLDSGRGGA